jgi:tetratricopeptide (TPR) repeat protein
VARDLAVVHGGHAERSATVDVKGRVGGGGTYAAPWYASGSLESQIEARSEAAKPDDPAAHLDIAEATLALSMRAPETYADPRTARVLSGYLQEEAKRQALEAERLGAKGWRLDTVLALSAYYGGEVEEAYKRAEAAVKALPAGDGSWASMAVVTVFAESRWKAIKAAVREQKEWPREWLTDLHAAYNVLLNHPLGTDGQVAWHYDFLDWLGADRRSDELLRKGLARFRTSEALHLRFRERTLKFRGPAALEAAYDEMLKASPEVETPAGAASIDAAEHYRRQGDFPNALAAYERAIAHFERGAADDPGNADVKVALALAGRARVAMQTGDDGKAVEWIVASLGRSPASAGTRDGMGITPGDTATMLVDALKTAKKEDLAGKVEAAAAKIDPELLRTPDE